jgi:short-subunit dehydrogenase
LDAVVNAAGIGGASSIEHFPLAKAEQLLATNILGTLNVIQATLPHLRERERGTFIAISSIAGLLGVPFHGIYSASKFAVEGLIESLRLELTATNVHAVSVCPGDTATPIISHQFRAKPEDLPLCYRDNYAKAERAMRESVAEGIPPVRIAETIDGIIHERVPGGRYTVGGALQKIAPLAKRWLPKPWFELVMKKYYGLN